MEKRHLFSLWFLFIANSLADMELQREFISIGSFQKRNELGETDELQFQAFGKNYHLRLERSDIFAPDFQFVTVCETSTGNPVLEKRSLQRDDLGDFYTVKDGFGSLHISKRDKLEINGFLDEDILIRSLRSEDIQNDLDHEILRPNIFQNIGTRDYVIPNKLQRRQTAATTQTGGTSNVPSKLTLELVPFLDYNNTEALQKNLRSIAQYLGIFYNNVNTRYAQLKDPEIGIVLSGVLLSNTPEDEPFPESKKYPNHRLDKTVLDDVQDWVASRTDLPQHDSILVHLSYDVGSFRDGKWVSNLAGLAYRGATCDTGGYNVAYSQDSVPNYTGILIVPHEIAHGLDCPHDGEEQSTNCAASEGYIMGSGQFGANSFKFSSCSKEAIRNFLKSDKADCLQGSYQSQYPMINQLPGLIEGPDDQCVARHGPDYISKQLFDPELCSTLWCGLEGSSFSSSGASLDGTTCGINKICLNGECVDNPVPTADQQCQSKYGITYFANQNDPNMCQNLICYFEHTFFGRSKGPPLQGTLCGNGGRCYGKVCKDQVPDANTQCIRLFNETFTLYKKIGANVCQTLGCQGSNGKILSYGGAMEGTECGLNGKCKNKVCSYF